MQGAQSGSIHLTRAQTRMMQQALNSGGLDAGPADGIMGEKTKEALKKYQSQKGLNASGQVDRQTLGALLSERGKQTASRKGKECRLSLTIRVNRAVSNQPNKSRPRDRARGLWHARANTTESQEPLDCAIIEGVPAGLTAALYLARFNRSFALFDGGDSRAAWIPESHNLPLFSHKMARNLRNFAKTA